MKLKQIAGLLSVGLFLVACRNDEEPTEEAEQGGVTQEELDENDENNETSEETENLTPTMSEAFDNYYLWFETRSTPERDTIVESIYLVENGEIRSLPARWNDDGSDLEDLNETADNEFTLEEILEMSDEEIVAFIDDEFPFDGISEVDELITDLHFDIELDGTGNSVEEIRLSHISPNHFISRLDRGADFNDTTFRFNAEDNVVPHQWSIFDITFSGFQANNANTEYLITRVEDNNVRFEMDTPSVSHPNVTIEGEPTE